MPKWVLLDADGATAAQIITARGELPGERDNPGGLRAVRVRRFGRAGERVGEDGRWALHDREAAAGAVDQAHIAAVGPLSIELARMEKRIEARIMLAGVAIDGVVAAEARATGQEPLTLAATIAAAAQASAEPEIARITAKRKARRQA